jgi:hypothetical protein
VKKILFAGIESFETGHPRKVSPQNIYNLNYNIHLKHDSNDTKNANNDHFNYEFRRDAGMRGFAGIHLKYNNVASPQIWI